MTRCRNSILANRLIEVVEFEVVGIIGSYEMAIGIIYSTVNGFLGINLAS